MLPLRISPSSPPTNSTILVACGDLRNTAAALAVFVLIHELGHACQYLGDLATYKTLFASGGIASIEADNLEKTEWPVCDDYGMMRRSNYMHYKGSGDTSKWQIVE